MGILDEFEELAGDFVEAFDNGQNGGTGGLGLYMRSKALGTYTAATQSRASTPTTTSKVQHWSRTRSQIYNGTSAAGSQRKFEEFFVVVRVSDAVAAGWTAGLMPSETTELIIDVDGAAGIFPVVSCERVMKEKAYRMRVRRDLGPAT